MAVNARGRDQRGQALDQFPGREAQLGAAIGRGFGQALEELVLAELFEPLRGSVFEALERSAMKPLPATLYEYAEWKLASVNFD